MLLSIATTYVKYWEASTLSMFKVLEVKNHWSTMSKFIQIDKTSFVVAQHMARCESARKILLFWNSNENVFKRISCALKFLSRWSNEMTPALFKHSSNNEAATSFFNFILTLALIDKRVPQCERNVWFVSFISEAVLFLSWFTQFSSDLNDAKQNIYSRIVITKASRIRHSWKIIYSLQTVFCLFSALRNFMIVATSF